MRSSHADRQDLFQEIVIQVWRSVDAFRGESSVPTWMYRVALNGAIAWTRKEAGISGASSQRSRTAVLEDPGAAR